ncbi:hypothetical protein EJ07DRAFT_178779 [Lizonia empirigonia]|nr:hypothetical protein EJ07DRAFT_178779 [Lizonia empirigonia]
MSIPSEEIVIARPTSDVAREVRIIRALYPQACLNHNTTPTPSSATSIAESRASSRTYHNTGVQTLPPPNGDVFKLIHGRDPSQIECTRNIGVAAIGRYTEDPRSSPYELMYGSAYTAPLPTKSVSYVDSGFQTASHQVCRMAMARAKVKASMTVNKYRGAAAQAGFVIGAESRDGYVVHSEQHSSALRFDGSGNLLDGGGGCGWVPNVFGRSVILSSAALKGSVESTVSALESVPSFSEGERLETTNQEASYPSPSQSPTTSLQILPKDSDSIHGRISALVPSSAEDDFNSGLAIDNEYGSVGPGTEKFVVFDAAVAAESSKRLVVTAGMLPSGKRKMVDLADGRRPMGRLRKSTAEELHEPSKMVKPSAGSSYSQSERARHTPERSSTKAPLKGLKRSLSRPGDERQESTLSVSQPTATIQIGNITRGSPDANPAEARASPNTFSVSKFTRHTDHSASQEDIQTPHSRMCIDDSLHHIKAVTTPPGKRSRSNTRDILKGSAPTMALDLPGDSSSRELKDRESPTQRLPLKSPQLSSDPRIQERSSDSFGGGAFPERHLVSSGRPVKLQASAKRPGTKTPSGITDSEHIETKSTSHISRASRKPFTPYVPPAKREHEVSLETKQLASTPHENGNSLLVEDDTDVAAPSRSHEAIAPAQVNQSGNLASYVLEDHLRGSAEASNHQPESAGTIDSNIQVDEEPHGSTISPANLLGNEEDLAANTEDEVAGENLSRDEILQVSEPELDATSEVPPPESVQGIEGDMNDSASEASTESLTPPRKIEKGKNKLEGPPPPDHPGYVPEGYYSRWTQNWVSQWMHLSKFRQWSTWMLLRG